MFSIVRYFYKYYFVKTLLSLLSVVFLCEYMIYFIVLIQCKWSTLDKNKLDPKILDATTEETPVYAMFLADTHLLGPKRGHWFDKLRREWQMYRTFQTVMAIHKPEVVFILGDIFDEGQWCSSEEFEKYILRFQAIFSVPKSTDLYVVSGNHDMGYHYVITPYLNKRFINGMNAPNVLRVSIRGNHFVLINSMALEGDGCFLCRSTELALNNISKSLKCAKGIGSQCNTNNIIKRYSKPILLQHFPLYRESDKICNELDQAPSNIKNMKFRERWDCLSREATEQILDILNPRLVIDGHTHHGCKTLHRNDILEVTIPSFSWRNKNNPSFLLGSFTPNNYALSKCFMPVESTVIRIYIFSATCIIMYQMIRLRRSIIYYYYRLIHH